MTKRGGETQTCTRLRETGKTEGGTGTEAEVDDHVLRFGLVGTAEVEYPPVSSMYMCTVACA